jgi:hypothetical protein
MNSKFVQVRITGEKDQLIQLRERINAVMQAMGFDMFEVGLPKSRDGGFVLYLTGQEKNAPAGPQYIDPIESA